MNRGGQISLWDLAFNSFGYIPEVELLDHMVILFLIFWGTTITSMLFYISTNNTWVPVSLYLYQHLLFSTKKIVILLGLGWYLIIVLICMISDNEHLFMCLLAVFMSSWRNVCSNPLPILELGFVWLSFRHFPYVLDVNPLSDAWFKIFYPILWVSLLLSW